MKTALVTGHLGFVGRHVHRRLLEYGWQVLGMDVALREIPVEMQTSRDMRIALQSDLYQDYSPDLVVHCAAVAPHRKAIDGNPLMVGTENMSLDVELFRWAAKARPGRIVYISSSAAYPVSLQHDIRPQKLEENDINPEYPDKPDGIYGWNKLTGERLCSAARYAGLKVTVVRPFSGYGADQSEDFPFGKFLARALNREDPFPVWGSGNQVRDFIHIDDIVSGIMNLIRAEVNGPVNLGTGVGTSFNELALMIAREVSPGYNPKIISHPNNPVGVAYRVANIENMRKYWEPMVTLQEGIRRAICE